MRKKFRKIKQFFYEAQVCHQTKHALLKRIEIQEMEIRDLERSKEYWKESAKANQHTAEVFCAKFEIAQTKLKILTEEKKCQE
jgi:hypothetical protein